MNSKERILNILNRKPVDRIPIDIWHTPEVYNDLAKHFNAKDDFDLYKKMGIDKWFWINAIYEGELAPLAENAAMVTQWGVQMKMVKSGLSMYGERLSCSFEDCTLENIDDYPYWPDPDKFNYSAAAQITEKVTNDFATLGPWVSFYEIYCGMRGLEKSMMDLVLEPEFVNAALDRIENAQTEMMKKLFEATGDSIDAIFISDDMGSQISLLMSPDMWDEFFKPRMKRWCDFIHSYGKKVFYHSDGAIEPLIPRLIDVGIDILNPIQHICPGMDMAELKEKYGKDLIFHGAVDTQDVLPFRGPEEVKKETLDCLQTLGKNMEGYVCCSCHNIQAGTSVENILAMVETVKNYSE